MEEDSEDPNYTPRADIQQLPEEVVIILNQGPFDNDHNTQELTVARYLAVAGENGPTFELIPDSARQSTESTTPPAPPAESANESGAASSLNNSWETKDDLDQVLVEFVKEMPPVSPPEKKPESSRSLRKKRRAAASSSYSHPSKARSARWKGVKTKAKPNPSRKLKFTDKVALIKRLRAEGELVCPISSCGMHFDKFRIFKHHYKRCVSDMKTPCPHCDKMLEPAQLPSHLQECHKKPKAARKEDSPPSPSKKKRSRPTGRRDSKNRKAAAPEQKPVKKDSSLYPKKKSTPDVSASKEGSSSETTDFILPSIVSGDVLLERPKTIVDDDGKDIGLEDLVFNHSSKRQSTEPLPRTKPHPKSTLSYPTPTSKRKGIQRLLHNINLRDKSEDPPPSTSAKPPKTAPPPLKEPPFKLLLPSKPSALSRLLPSSLKSKLASPSSSSQTCSSPEPVPATSSASNPQTPSEKEASHDTMALPSLPSAPGKKKPEQRQVSLSRDWGSDRKTYKKGHAPPHPEQELPCRSALKTPSHDPKPKKLSVRFQSEPEIFSIDDFVAAPAELQSLAPAPSLQQQPAEELPQVQTSPNATVLTPTELSELQVPEAPMEESPLQKSPSPTLTTLQPMDPLSYLDPGSENDSNSQNIAPEPPPVKERPKPSTCKPIPKMSRHLVKKMTSKVIHDIYQLPPISANKEQISLKSFIEPPNYDTTVFSSLTNLREKPPRKLPNDEDDIQVPVIPKKENPTPLVTPPPPYENFEKVEEVNNPDEEAEDIDNPTPSSAPPAILTPEMEEAKKKMYSSLRWSKGKNRMKYINAIQRFNHDKEPLNQEQLLLATAPRPKEKSDQSKEQAPVKNPATPKATTTLVVKRCLENTSREQNDSANEETPTKKPAKKSRGNVSSDKPIATPKLSPNTTIVKVPLPSSAALQEAPRRRGRKRKQPPTPEIKPIIVTEQEQIPQILKLIQPYINQLNSPSTKVLIIPTTSLNAAPPVQDSPAAGGRAHKKKGNAQTDQSSPATSTGTKPKRRGRQKLVPDSSDEETPEGPYTCSACKLEMEDYQDARNHVWKLHNGLARLNNDVVWKENECIARLRKALKKNKQLKCMVPECTRVFQNELGFFYHYRTCGNENPYVECEYCGKKLKLFSLRPHIQNFHHTPSKKEEEPEESEHSSAEEEDKAPLKPSPRGKVRQAAYRARHNVRKFIRRQKGLVEDEEEIEEESEQEKKEDSDHSLELDSEDEEEMDDEDEIPEWRPQKLNYSYRRQLQAWAGHFSMPGHLVSPEMEQSWNSQLIDAGYMACKAKGCAYKTDIMEEMMEHLGSCAKRDNIWKCLICNTIFDHSNYIFYHLKAHHSDKINKDTIIVKQNYLKPLTEAMEWTLKFHMSQENVPTFPKLRHHLEKWEYHFPGWEKYLPPLPTSPHYKTSSPGTSWKQLECFEAETPEKSSSHLTLFAGGPVWALAWCPTPPGVIEEQFLALATGPPPGTLHPLMPPSKGPGLIQVWEMGYLTFARALAKPRMCLALAHDEGPVWEIAWGPAGCWEDPQEVSAPRLGLLAAAFNSGNIHIYSIPHPSSVEEVGGAPVFWTQPLVTFPGPGRGGPSYLAQPSPCCSLDWHGDQLSAGYSTGVVAVWRLPGSKDPRLTFPAHQGAVTAVRWCPRFSNSRFLATCGLDRAVKVWDLDNIGLPIMSYRSGLLRDIKWGLHWCGVVAAQDDAFTHLNHTFFRESGYYHFGTQLALHNSTIWSVSLSDWLNAQVSCDHAGELVAAILPDLSKPLDAKGLAKNRIPLYRVEMETLGGEPEVREVVEALVTEVTSNTFGTSRSCLQRKLESELAALPHNAADAELLGGLKRCLRDNLQVGPLVEELENFLLPLQSGAESRPQLSSLVACLRHSILALKNLMGVRLPYQETAAKFGLVFHDHNLKNITKIPRTEYARLHKSERMNKPDVGKFPLSSLTSVSWNPNLGSHLWVASGGHSGLVRLSLIAGLYQPSMEAAVKKAHTWRSSCT